jgi:hypothetical protein
MTAGSSALVTRKALIHPQISQILMQGFFLSLTTGPTREEHRLNKNWINTLIMWPESSNSQTLVSCNAIYTPNLPDLQIFENCLQVVSASALSKPPSAGRPLERQLSRQPRPADAGKHFSKPFFLQVVSSLGLPLRPPTWRTI